MASVKRGVLVRSPQWWKHLRDWKRTFWKRHRKAEAALSVVDQDELWEEMGQYRPDETLKRYEH